MTNSLRRLWFVKIVQSVKTTKCVVIICLVLTSGNLPFHITFTRVYESCVILIKSFLTFIMNERSINYERVCIDVVRYALLFCMLYWLLWMFISLKVNFIYFFMVYFAYISGTIVMMKSPIYRHASSLHLVTHECQNNCSNTQVRSLIAKNSAVES